MNGHGLKEQQFKALATQGYNWIPVYREILADLETPLTCYLKLAQKKNSYLLESVQGGEKWGRYSIIGLPCQRMIRVYQSTITLTDGDKTIEEIQTNDPLNWINDYQKRYKVPIIAELPRFCGGLVGYFSYDTVRYVEKRLRANTKPDQLATPDIALLQSDEVVVYDNLKGELILIVHVDPSQTGVWEKAQQRLDALETQLKQSLPTHIVQKTKEKKGYTANISKAEYSQAIKKIKQYIIDGDVMQVVYAPLQISMPFSADPIQLYRALRFLNPSPYMYYLNWGDFFIVGSSPEILVRVESGNITLRPLAGTRKRGSTEAEDIALEKDLLSDPKECAEHLMLIDLGRNDVGRVSQAGSVKLTEKMQVERYSHVMHIVSEVQGQLKSGYNSTEALKATLPAGTLSGAPKIRAMEIIDELEKNKRGIYGGAIGYISWHDNIDTAIAIRTGVIKDNILYFQVGAGIVYDSQPDKEWQECINKAQAMLSAVRMVEDGF